MYRTSLHSLLALLPLALPLTCQKKVEEPLQVPAGVTSKPSFSQAGVATTQPAAKPQGGFSRFVKTGKLKGRFETAITSYKNSKGQEVDLIAAVHIADQAYYAKLQKRMKGYDALLYELVAAKGTVPRKGRKSTSLISKFQRFLKNQLDLEFQLDAIDYTQKNFVHADLSPKEFREKQEKRGESILGLLLRSAMQASQQTKNSEEPQITIFHLIAGLFAKNQAHYFKFLFAQELSQIEARIASFGDDKGAQSAIIGDRNSACFAVLSQQLSTGKKKIGIFYGAAHLPDMESRLLKLGFKRTKQIWLTAWNLE